VTAELVLEASAGTFTFGLDETLDSGAMLEQSWRPASCARMSRGCGFHVSSIGPEAPAGNPWRE
jgi:hypothetical protein